MFARMMQTFKKILQRQTSASMFLAVLGGCAPVNLEPSKPPVTVSDVVRMSEEGCPTETIVKKMRESKTVYRLNAAQLAQLHDQGVQDEVINYMQQTYLDAVRREEDLANWNDWGMWDGHFW